MATMDKWPSKKVATRAKEVGKALVEMTMNCEHLNQISRFFFTTKPVGREVPIPEKNVGFDGCRNKGCDD
jgi:hypothetical protein